MVVFWGPDLLTLYNDAFGEILGWKHPAALAAPASEVFEEAWTIVGPMLRGVLESGHPTHSRDLPFTLKRKGFLEECYFEFSAGPIFDDGGGVAGVFAPISETTERVLGQRRLRTLHELGRLDVSCTTADACREATRVLSANPLDVPAAAIYLVEEQRIRMVCSTDDADNVAYFPAEMALDPAAAPIWPVADVIQKNRSLQIEPLLWLHPVIAPGDTTPLAILAIAISTQLEFDGAYSSFCDVLASHVARLLEQTAAFERTRKEAEALAELDRNKTNFFSNISHEFRTPLTLLLGPIEELLSQAQARPEEERERLQMAHRNAQRLLRLVNALLDFARIEGGRMSAHYEPVPLGEVTTDLASVFRSAIESAGLRFVVDCPPLDEPVYVDRDMWEKIILNLLSNALKFTFGGAIRITLRRDGNTALLTVSDTGVGIPAEELPRIFDRFHRVEGKRARTYEGSGIGLALVQELAHLHGGRIEVESEVKKGSSFRVRMPLGTAHLPPDALDRRTGRAQNPRQAFAFVEEASRWLPEDKNENGEPESDKLRPRIVLADDNADVRAYVKRLLNRYEVLTATDGIRALELVRTRIPDLVLLDVTMPGMDGVSVLRELRDDAATRSLPVILLSARAGADDRIEGLEAGADDYLQKPFNARELVARVGAHLQMARMRDAAERHQKELRAQAEAANRMLELANEELRQFSYAASHDLQAPIRMIGTHAEMVSRKLSAADPDTQDSIGFILAGVDRMRNLVRDLLTYSVTLHADREPDVPVDLNFVLSQVLMMHQPLILETGAVVHADPLPTIPAQWSSILQLLQNLVGNAVKYRHPDRAPEVRLHAERQHDLWLLTVEDNGVGFDPKYSLEIFGLFKRLQGDAVPGSGLGLAICKRLVEKRGGRIWAESEPGAGSRFYFTLPTGSSTLPAGS